MYLLRPIRYLCTFLWPCKPSLCTYVCPLLTCCPLSFFFLLFCCCFCYWRWSWWCRIVTSAAAKTLRLRCSGCSTPTSAGAASRATSTVRTFTGNKKENSETHTKYIDTCQIDGREIRLLFFPPTKVLPGTWYPDIINIYNLRVMRP